MYRLSLLTAFLALVFSTLTTAYRPVQFVKHTGQSGRADQAFSLVNYYNETTQQSDLYVRMWMYRYHSDAKGWAALALGPRMYGSLMFIIYGDPTAFDEAVTLSVRTADGHHPPRPIDEMKEMYSGPVPDVDVVSARFQPYKGDYYSEEVKAKPSHLGVANFIVRGYEQWTAAELPISNSSLGQTMIWSSNFKQDFQADYSVERAIDMHQFGLGFGFLWVDLANAASPNPFFGEIVDTEGHKGVDEIDQPDAPTDTELTAGKAIIATEAVAATAALAAGASTGTPAEDTAPKPEEDKQSSPDEAGPDSGNQVEEPVKTAKQWNIRSLMWHLHGFLMTSSFLILYPLGVYFLRTPRPTAFNLHWTINSLGSVSAGLGAIVGFINSRSISITHQYVGILIVCGLAVQTVLGWRHHIIYLQVQRKTWMSSVHMWLGRVVLPMGMINVITGLLLRQYGWLTVSLTIALAAVEVIVLTLVVGRARMRRGGDGGVEGQGGPKLGQPMGLSAADEAEEYFQLTGDDDDEFSDEDGAEGAGKAAERSEQQKRLAKLDKV